MVVVAVGAVVEEGEGEAGAGWLEGVVHRRLVWRGVVGKVLQDCGGGLAVGGRGEVGLVGEHRSTSSSCCSLLRNKLYIYIRFIHIYNYSIEHLFHA